MNCWLLNSVRGDQRLHQGNPGYDDDFPYVYRFDSLVPNSSQVREADCVFLREQAGVIGFGFVTRLGKASGFKDLFRCPRCGSTKLKRRKVKRPTFRCECRSCFEKPFRERRECILFEAFLGGTVKTFEQPKPVAGLWKTAPRLNKQHSILRLDPRKVEELFGIPLDGRP